MSASIVKAVFFITISFLASNIYGQAADSVGIDDNAILSRQESNFLNTLLKKENDALNLTGRKVAFLTGSTGGNVIAKSEYFKSYIRPWTDKGLSPQCLLVWLTEEEKLKSGGYDALLLTWVKLFTNKQRRKVVTRLQSTTR